MDAIVDPRKPGAIPQSLLNETLLLFSELSKLVRPPGQRPIHISTLMRWRQTGIRGIQLEAVRLGGRWFTSEAAVSRFIARLSEAKPLPISPPSQQSKAYIRDLDRSVAFEGL